MQQGVKPTETQVRKNQNQPDMQGAQTGSSKQRDKQVVLKGQTQQGNQQKQIGKTQQGKQKNQTGTTQQGAKVIQKEQTQQGNQQKQIGKTHQGDQSNHTSENQQDQYNTLCQKMKQKRQNFTRATEELNAAAKQLLTKRKQNKEQYFQHTNAQCRNAIPKMMNAEASTQQGVAKVKAFGKGLGKNAVEGVGKLSRNLGGFFRKK